MAFGLGFRFGFTLIRVNKRRSEVIRVVSVSSVPGAGQLSSELTRIVSDQLFPSPKRCGFGFPDVKCVVFRFWYDVVPFACYFTYNKLHFTLV